LTGKIIGVTGAIASGKSTVARMLVDLGAALISADDIAKELLQKDDVKAQITCIWGSCVLAQGGEVDREALAKRVFSGSAEVQRLNAILHPRIISRIKQEIERLRREHPAQPIVLDAALLHEAGLAPDCDVVIFVDAEDKRRYERAKWHRGWDIQEIARRERLQMPVKQKKLKADYVIHNNGEIGETRARALEFWRKVLIEN